MAKKLLNPLEALESQLRARFPEATISLDAPARASGTWFLDVSRDGHVVVIAWRQGDGFGVSSSAIHGYGEGADEVYQDQEAAYGRVVSLLLSRTHTAPPELVRLRDLRKQRGISQVELASLLGTQQGAVSRLERRRDLRLSTVRDVVRSMGGTLQIIVRFPDGVERTLEFEEEAPAHTAGKKTNGR